MRPRPRASAEVLVRAVREAEALDAELYATIAATPSPALDEGMRRLSRAADFSRLWGVTACALAVGGGSAGRRAAGDGVVAIGLASALTNQGLKRIHRRPRPDRAVTAVPLARHVPLPESTSFPSGHAASAFAFATAAGQALPVAGGPLRVLAALVAYSRVHTGVHYPGDVVAGALVGSTTGGLVASLAARRRRQRASR
jgi:membrane-associated phospholipid phosphatase